MGPLRIGLVRLLADQPAEGQADGAGRVVDLEGERVHVVDEAGLGVDGVWVEALGLGVRFGLVEDVGEGG